ncbi:MAG TPA: alpha/beta fold hydrolase, partial [Albitalea sp.]|nr:alpha/beta fold hydrolase [Albitalea sp.]
MKNFAEVQAALATVWGELPALLGDGLVAFEARLLPLLRELEAQPANPARVEAVLALLEADYPAVYERLVESLAAEKAPAVKFRGTAGAVKPTVGRYLVVPVWYATDRKNTGAAAPAERYSGDKGKLQFGKVEVSIPDSHEKGLLEKPSLFRLQFRADPEKHVVLLSLEQADAAAWKAELEQALAGCDSHDALLFIHGFNVGFEDAARRAAQFAHDLEFQGVPLLYSWPSEGKTLAYTIDEDNALWTVDDFEEVMKTLLTEVGAKRLHVVAHSMGNRVLTEGLRRIDVAALPAGAAKLHEVVFAAPDVNADTFRNFVAKFYGRAQRFTLYASKGDKALETSQKLHKYPRAGDAGDGVVLCEGLETVDATAVDQT